MCYNVLLLSVVVLYAMKWKEIWNTSMIFRRCFTCWHCCCSCCFHTHFESLTKTTNSDFRFSLLFKCDFLLLFSLAHSVFTLPSAFNPYVSVAVFYMYICIINELSSYTHVTCNWIFGNWIEVEVEKKEQKKCKRTRCKLVEELKTSYF